MSATIQTVKAREVRLLQSQRRVLDVLLAAFDRAVEAEDAEAAEKWLTMAGNQIGGIERQLEAMQ